MAVDDSEIILALQKTAGNAAAAGRLLDIKPTRVAERVERLNGLWRHLAKHPQAAQVRDQLILAYLPWAEFLATGLLRKEPGWVDKPDALTAVHEALIERVDSFDPSRGFSFGAFARRRILGAVYDDIDRQSWRSQKDRYRLAEQLATEEVLSHALGRRPTEAEVAEAMGLPENQLVQPGKPASSQRPGRATGAAELLEMLPGYDKDVQGELFDHLTEGLSSDQRTVLYLHYMCGHELAVIAKVLHRSPASVSLTKRRAVLRIKTGGRLEKLGL